MQQRGPGERLGEPVEADAVLVERHPVRSGAGGQERVEATGPARGLDDDG